MIKYINADELKDKISELAEDDYCVPLGEYIDGLRQRTEGILDIVDKMPSADFEKVVRCKDCKKYKPYENDNFPCGECGNCSYDVRPRVVGDNDYCSDAERKEAENG